MYIQYEGVLKQIIEWVKELARKEQREYLRLDCYADRNYLMQLY